MRYVLLFALTLLAPALYADGDLAFVPDDIDVTPDVATQAKPPHKPHPKKPHPKKTNREAPPAAKPARPAPHAAAPPAPAEPIAPPAPGQAPGQAPAPAPRPARPRPAAAQSTTPAPVAPRPAAKPRPVAWSTPYQCPGHPTNRMDIAGDMVQHSLGFRNVYSETLVAQDRSSSFQIAKDRYGYLQVVLSAHGMTFNAPAQVCEQQPGVLVATVNSAQRNNCLPVDTCSTLGGFIEASYTVQLSRPAQGAGNAIIVSGNGLSPGVYIGQQSAAAN